MTLKQIIKMIVAMFSTLNGSKFVGVREYLSKTSGEVANHVVNVNFSYGNAVKKDLKALQCATKKDIQAIAKNGFSIELIEQAIAKLSTSFINNMNKETASNQSKAQNDAYIKINDCVKYCIETKEIMFYAMAISKKVIVPGTYKTVKSRELTLCQNAIKKHFDFSTSKFRQFIISKEHLSKVVSNGENYDLEAAIA